MMILKNSNSDPTNSTFSIDNVILKDLKHDSAKSNELCLYWIKYACGFDYIYNISIYITPVFKIQKMWDRG